MLSNVSPSHGPLELVWTLDTNHVGGSQITCHGILWVPKGKKASLWSGIRLEQKILKKKVENYQESSLFILHLRMEALESLSRTFQAILGSSGQSSRGLKPSHLFIRLTLLRRSREMGTCRTLELQRWQTSSPPSRSCPATHRWGSGSLCSSADVGSELTYILVQGPQRREKSLWINRSFSKNNSVLLTNIYSIGKFLNIQQTSVHSTNICLLASVDSVPALCLLLGGDCRQRCQGQSARQHEGQSPTKDSGRKNLFFATSLSSPLPPHTPAEGTAWPSFLLPNSSFINKPFKSSRGPSHPRNEQTSLSREQFSELLEIAQMCTTSKPASLLLGM